MFKVRAFYRKSDSVMLAQADRVLPRIPTVGEHLQLQPRGEWYVVRAVVFGAMPSANQAELYLELTDKEAFLRDFGGAAEPV